MEIIDMQTYEVVDKISPLIAAAYSKLEQKFKEIESNENYQKRKEVFISHGKNSKA